MGKVFEDEVRADRFMWDEGDMTITKADGTVLMEAKGLDPSQPIPHQPELTPENEREVRKIQRRFESGALARLAYGEATVEEIEADTVFDDSEHP